MMKFYARDGHMQPLPKQNPLKRRRYYGRTSQIRKDAEGKPAGIVHAPNDKPFSVDENSEEGRELLRICRLEMPLVPADKETSDLVGVPFRKPVKANNGEWDFETPKETTKPAKGATGGND